MRSYYAYAFLAGIYIGGYTNLFSKVVISGLVLYIVHPENFDPRRFTPLYNRIYDGTYPYLSKIYNFNNSSIPITNNSKNNSLLTIEDIPKEKRVTDITSPLALKLPPLDIKK